MARLVHDPAARERQSARARETVRVLRGGAHRAVGCLTSWGLWPVE
jgi:hypothetical protein